MNEPAGHDTLLCVGGGKTLYIGAAGSLDWHFHGAPVFIAGMTGKFRLRLPSGAWVLCRAAVIPPGVCHALELGDVPLAVFYPEANIASLSDLTRLGHEWAVHDRVLVGQRAELVPFRELYENPRSLDFAGEALDHLVDFARAGGVGPSLDPRIARVIEWLDACPEDLTPLGALAQVEGLSVSRFLHLFSQEIGVPFRCFRIWNRLRAAMRLRVAGSNLTEAAFGAGFSDSAHFSRLHRRTFGRTPSSGYRTAMRAINLADNGATEERGRAIARLRTRYAALGRAH